MIKFENVQISYGDFVAVDDLNLEIKEGEFFTFLGPSGCGKSTTLRTLVGFIDPSKGSIFVDDKDITRLAPEKREIGIVFQSYALFPTMTVYDNIAYGLKIKKMPKSEIDAKVNEIAQKIKISDKQLQRNVSELSGGQQQRVALARALVLEPKILCLDEPLSNLDAKLRVDLRLELKRLQRDLGITTLYVTHEFVCDFIGDINKLTEETMKELTGKEEEKVGYIRLERIKFKSTSEEDYTIKGTVIDTEFKGVLVQYTVKAESGQILRVIQKNDYLEIFELGQELTLFIHPNDILQY